MSMKGYGRLINLAIWRFGDLTIWRFDDLLIRELENINN